MTRLIIPGGSTGSLHAAVRALATLAGWFPLTPARAGDVPVDDAGTHAWHTAPATANSVAFLPAVANGVSFGSALPLLVSTRQFSVTLIEQVEIGIRASGSPALIIVIEDRQKRPRIRVTPGMPGDPIAWYPGYRPWLSSAGHLWLVTGSAEEASMPGFALTADGLTTSMSPFLDPHDHRRGCLEADLNLAYTAGAFR